MRKYKFNVLHLIHDDKFFDSTINLFRYFGIQSRFILLCERKKQLKYIKQVAHVQQIELGSAEYNLLIQSVDKYNIVWIHYLDTIKAKFINQMPLNKKVKIFWSSWGEDYVSLLGYSKLRFKSRLCWFKSLSLRGKCSFVLKSLFSKIGINLDFRLKDCFKVLQKVDYFSTILLSEETFLRKGLGSRPRYCHYMYTSLPPTVLEYPRCEINAKKIWLGNSATYSNNHLDLLPILKEKEGWDIIAPLSYGSSTLIQEIDKKAKKSLGNRWSPIFDFMPYESFLKKMSECNVFVFDIFRQQAMGNIIAALRMGGCVFLNQKNPAYLELCSSGIKVYSINDLKKHFDESIEDFYKYRDENIKRMNELRSHNQIESQLRLTMDFLEEQCNEIV